MLIANVQVTKEDSQLVAWSPGLGGISCWAPTQEELREKFRNAVAACMLTLGIQSLRVRSGLGEFKILNVRECTPHANV